MNESPKMCVSILDCCLPIEEEKHWSHVVTLLATNSCLEAGINYANLRFHLDICMELLDQEGGVI